MTIKLRNSAANAGQRKRGSDVAVVSVLMGQRQQISCTYQMADDSEEIIRYLRTKIAGESTKNACTCLSFGDPRS